MLDLAALATVISHNQFLSGGLALGGVGGFLVWMKGIPNQIMGWIERQIFVTIEVYNQDPLYDTLKEWLDNHPYSKKARWLNASTDRIGGKRVVLFTPAPGSHLFRFNGKWIWLTRERKDSEMGAIPKETIHISYLGRTQTTARELFRGVIELDEKEVYTSQGIYITTQYGWERISKRIPRPLDSVILPNGTVPRLIRDLENFYSTKEWYTENGIPHTRGYLFYGVSGSGKSSLASAISGYFKKDLYLINLSEKGMSDASLQTSMMTIPYKGVLLLEDVDAVFDQRENKDDRDSAITFSGLLNAIDGVAIKDGLVLIMSTNHIEKLDSALIRPGRVDVQLEMGKATYEQAYELFSRFFPGSNAQDFAISHADQFSMAELQGKLLVKKIEEHELLLLRTGLPERDRSQISC